MNAYSIYCTCIHACIHTYCTCMHTCVLNVYAYMRTVLTVFACIYTHILASHYLKNVQNAVLSLCFMVFFHAPPHSPPWHTHPHPGTHIPTLAHTSPPWHTHLHPGTHISTMAHAHTYTYSSGVLVMMEARVATLKSTFERVSTRVSVPYTKIQERTQQLSRLQVSTSHIFAM